MQRQYSARFTPPPTSSAAPFARPNFRQINLSSNTRVLCAYRSCRVANLIWHWTRPTHTCATSFRQRKKWLCCYLQFFCLVVEVQVNHPEKFTFIPDNRWKTLSIDVKLRRKPVCDLQVNWLLITTIECNGIESNIADHVIFLCVRKQSRFLTY